MGLNSQFIENQPRIITGVLKSVIFRYTGKVSQLKNSRLIKFLFSLLLVGLTFGANAQSCLQLLDSVLHYKYIQNEKTIFYGKTLLQKLDNNECNVDIGLIGVYNNVGLAVWEAKDQTLAMKAFQKALGLAKTAEDSVSIDQLDTYYNLSALYSEKGNFAEAGNMLLKADKIVQNTYGFRSLENVLHQFKKGIFYRETGKFNESMTALNGAEIIGQEIQLEDSLQIRLLIEIGTTFRHFGDLDASEEKLTEAIKKAKQIGNQLLYLTAIDRLSALKIEQGEYSDSESYLLHNLDMKNKNYPNDSILVLETLNGLGLLYYKINDIASAQKHLEEALKLTAEMRTIKPYMMNNLATIYMRQGRTEEALRYFQQSAEGFRALFGSMHPDYASCINNLAHANKELGNLGEALNLYMKVLDMDKVIYGQNHQRYATTLNNIGLIYMQLGNTSLAGKLLDNAIKVRSQALGDQHPLYVKSLNDMGLYHLANQDTLSALRVLNDALTTEIQHMRRIFPVLTRKQRQLYFKETKNNVERFCALAFSDQYFNTEWSEIALNHFINTKGILFYAADKMRKLVQSSDDESIKKTYEQWRDVKYKLAQAYLLSEEERRSHGISIEQLQQTSTDLEKKLSLSFKVFSDQENDGYYTWQQVGKALPDSSVALEVIQYRNYTIRIEGDQINQGFEDRSDYVAFIIASDSILKSIKWSKYADFDRGYKQYTNLLKFGVIDTASYNTFWKVVDKEIPPVKRVYMAPDGIFYKVNPSVFFDGESNQYVSDKYDIINITSTKDFLNRQPKNLKREARIFGNPAFATLGDEYQLAPLPGAEREAQDITNILDVRKWKSETYYFNDATEDRVKELNNPGVVHIATHGFFKEDPNFSEPLNSSGLYLSKAGGEDGVLTAYEAMNLVLDQTSVVVLAACETGLGTVKNGEGVFGLQRAFLVAGADNVLISLVKINDQAARRFMNLYYEQLRLHEDPQDAFFNARSIFKEENKNPYNWGAYILVARN